MMLLIGLDAGGVVWTSGARQLIRLMVDLAVRLVRPLYPGRFLLVGPLSLR